VAKGRRQCSQVRRQFSCQFSTPDGDSNDSEIHDLASPSGRVLGREGVASSFYTARWQLRQRQPPPTISSFPGSSARRSPSRVHYMAQPVRITVAGFSVSHWGPTFALMDCERLHVADRLFENWAGGFGHFPTTGANLGVRVG